MPITPLAQELWNDHCWLEFHWYDMAVSKQWVTETLRIGQKDFFDFTKSSAELGPLLTLVALGPDFDKVGGRKILTRADLVKPVVFLNPCSATVVRDQEMGIFNANEYTVPVYQQDVGCSLVRATKIPAGVGSLAHSSAAGDDDGFFHLAFTGATWEKRHDDGQFFMGARPPTRASRGTVGRPAVCRKAPRGAHPRVSARLAPRRCEKRHRRGAARLLDAGTHLADAHRAQRDALGKCDLRADLRLGEQNDARTNIPDLEESKPCLAGRRHRSVHLYAHASLRQDMLPAQKDCTYDKDTGKCTPGTEVYAKDRNGNDLPTVASISPPELTFYLEWGFYSMKRWRKKKNKPSKADECKDSDEAVASTTCPKGQFPTPIQDPKKAEEKRDKAPPKKPDSKKSKGRQDKCKAKEKASPQVHDKQLECAECKVCKPGEWRGKGKGGGKGKPCLANLPRGKDPKKVRWLRRPLPPGAPSVPCAHDPHVALAQTSKGMAGAEGVCTKCDKCNPGTVRVGCGSQGSNNRNKYVGEKGRCVYCERLCPRGEYSTTCDTASHYKPGALKQGFEMVTTIRPPKKDDTGDDDKKEAEVPSYDEATGGPGKTALRQLVGPTKESDDFFKTQNKDAGSGGKKGGGKPAGGKKVCSGTKRRWSQGANSSAAFSSTPSLALDARARRAS